MRPEGEGTVVIKGTQGRSHPLPQNCSHMQLRTQPLAQVLPFSLGGVLRDAGLRVPVIKMGTGWQNLLRTLKEIAYILLCCWCVKELLD
ncbi:lens epithelial cell protein LEP503 [Lepus europaeus]|uniref:lens epithelial cell protein LEP503 n=1 Tax=Lepus europaeus TaxID=9983 RepID=UPI002B45CD02|nr:lens epithelial cell protein LEP503 [Lepus europaeus]